jgi:hypothetical protein
MITGSAVCTRARYADQERLRDRRIEVGDAGVHPGTLVHAMPGEERLLVRDGRQRQRRQRLGRRAARLRLRRPDPRGRIQPPAFVHFSCFADSTDDNRPETGLLHHVGSEVLGSEVVVASMVTVFFGSDAPLVPRGSHCSETCWATSRRFVMAMSERKSVPLAPITFPAAGDDQLTRLRYCRQRGEEDEEWDDGVTTCAEH